LRGRPGTGRLNWPSKPANEGARKNAEVAIRSPFAVLGKRIVALAGENGASEPEINQSISEKVESGFPSENATDATMLERFLFPVR
jgi:hypothetical protein